jgi:site-specific DNA recombinase
MNNLEKTEKQLLKEILSGKYRNHFLVYNRKSTDEPNNQKNSITYQRSENAKFIYREKLLLAPITIKGFCVDGVISEKHSGFKEDNDITITDDGLIQYRIDRPKFHKLIQFLSTGSFKGVVCLCWDRISRNKGDDTAIRKLMRKGIDVRFVYAKYDKTSSGALHMDIDGMFAEHHSRVTSEKVSTTIRSLRERGICTHRAPIGYLNVGDMGNKPLDPERAPVIKSIFELYATGDWSLSDMARWANGQGLTTVPMRRRRTEEEMLAEEEEEVQIARISRPITANMIHKIITNPFYIGRVIGNGGEYVPSNSHEALVSEELFDKVQRTLEKKKLSKHYTNKLDFPHRGLVRCLDCGRVYTPYEKKGIQYFYSRCVEGCPNPRKNFNIDFLEKGVGGLMINLAFTEDELAEIDARTATDVSLLEEKRHREFEHYDARKKKIREDLLYLHSNRLPLLKTGIYTPETYLEEESRLNIELASLQNAEQTSDVAMHEVIKDLVKLSELLKDGYAYYSFADSREKEQIIRVIFSELSVSGDKLKYKCKNGFQALESRFVAVGDPTTWLSELISHKDYILISLRELRRLVKNRIEPIEEAA